MILDCISTVQTFISKNPAFLKLMQIILIGERKLEIGSMSKQYYNNTDKIEEIVSFIPKIMLVTIYSKNHKKNY